MIKLLVRKQLAEVFKGYFFDAKKNKARSKVGVVLWFIFFAVIMVVVLGGMFTGLSILLCEGLIEAKVGWLYFVIMGGMAILLGAFGSVFNTYAGLYLAKDNDLLLSMPIPVKDIIISRLLNVYLMGSMYSLVVILPALVVYWLTADLGFMNGLDIGFPEILCGLLFALLITVIVLILSALLGWGVAKLSVKLKNKSYLTVLISLLFIGGYYFFYFRAQLLIQDLLLNAAVYGEKIKGAAYALYLFGRMGCGDWGAAAIVTAVVAAVLLATWLILKKTFLSIAISGGTASKVRYTEKTAKQNSLFGALLSKEFARFTSSASYMLNCGIGLLFLLAIGVFLLIKGSEYLPVLELLLVDYPGAVGVVLATAFMTMAGTVDSAAPAVSLEGKSIWIPQSLPVEPRLMLRAKTAVQVLLTAVPMAFSLLCGLMILPASLPVKLLTAAIVAVFTVFNALFDSFLGIRFANLNWTNELYPIKQSAAVAFALFGGWLFAVAFAGLYFLIGHKLGATAYLAIWVLLYAAAAAALLRWQDTRGAARFSAL